MRLELVWQSVDRIAGRHAPFVRRVMRYGVTGLAISIAYSLAVILCVWNFPRLGPTWASVLAFVAILPFSYLAHRGISFSDRRGGQHERRRFIITTTSSFLVAVGGMYVITEILGLSFYLGILWNWMIIPASNFCIYNLWVFSAHHAHPPTPSDDSKIIGKKG